MSDSICPADAKSEESGLSNGVGVLRSEQPPFLVDVLNRIAEALERQTLLLADLLNQNTAILESLIEDDDDEEAEPGEYMDGTPRG